MYRFLFFIVYIIYTHIFLCISLKGLYIGANIRTQMYLVEL